MSVQRELDWLWTLYDNVGGDKPQFLTLIAERLDCLQSLVAMQTEIIADSGRAARKDAEKEPDDIIHVESLGDILHKARKELDNVPTKEHNPRREDTS